MAGMREKGRLQAGADADIVVFDAARVGARATYGDAKEYSQGFEYVMVNGQFVVYSKVSWYATSIRAGRCTRIIGSRSSNREAKPMSRARLGNGAIGAALRVSCGILASLCGTAAGHADTGAADGRLAATFHSIDQAVASVPTPGIVIGITDRNRLHTVIVHGYADLKKRTPLTRDSLFPIGSISKSFTAVMLMELKDEGRFDPQAPIRQYLPQFALKSRFRPVTGHDLLSHTAGLPLYRGTCHPAAT